MHRAQGVDRREEKDKARRLDSSEIRKTDIMVLGNNGQNTPYYRCWKQAALPSAPVSQYTCNQARGRDDTDSQLQKGGISPRWHTKRNSGTPCTSHSNP